MKNRTIGISLQYLNTVLNLACGLFLSSFLLRVLGDTEYGLYQTVGSFVNYLVLLEFGAGTVITRNISACKAINDSEGIQKNISTVLTITYVLIGIILMTGMVFYAAFGTIYSRSLSSQQIEYGKRILLVLLAYLIISFFANTINGILLGYEKYDLHPKISIARVIIRTLLLVVLVLEIKKSIVIALIDLALAVSVDVFLVVYCKRKLEIKFTFRYFDWIVFKNSLPLAAAIFIQVLINQANNNVDKFIIGIKNGPEDVAVYSIGLYIYSIFSTMTTIPIAMYGPQVVKEITQGLSPDDVSSHLIQPSRIIVLIGGTILFGFFAVGRQFVILVYGESYSIAWKVALIIMAPMLINMSNGAMINILDATNKRMARSGLLLFTTIANIILTVILIGKFGIIGACIATAICTIIGQVTLSNGAMINILDATNKRMARSGLLLFTTIANIILTVILIGKFGIIGACIATAICTIIGQVTLMDLYYYYKLKIRVFSFKMKTFNGILFCQIISGIIAFLIGRIIKHTVVSLLAGGAAYIIIFGVLFFLFGANVTEKSFMRKKLNMVD